MDELKDALCIDYITPTSMLLSEEDVTNDWDFGTYRVNKDLGL